MAKFKRHYSTPEMVERWRSKIDQCLCHYTTPSGRKRHGIIHKVFAARHYDGVRVLVASDEGGVFTYHDVLDINAH